MPIPLDPWGAAPNINFSRQEALELLNAPDISWSWPTSPGDSDDHLVCSFFGSSHEQMEISHRRISSAITSILPGNTDERPGFLTANRTEDFQLHFPEGENGLRVGEFLFPVQGEGGRYFQTIADLAHVGVRIPERESFFAEMATPDIPRAVSILNSPEVCWREEGRDLWCGLSSKAFAQDGLDDKGSIDCAKLALDLAVCGLIGLRGPRFLSVVDEADESSEYFLISSYCLTEGTNCRDGKPCETVKEFFQSQGVVIPDSLHW